MYFFPFLASLTIALITLRAPSFKFSPSTLLKRCTNSVTDRNCQGDYDITTNYYNKGPNTGVIQEYWFEIINIITTLNNIKRLILSINSTVPRPTIIVDWGDIICELTYSELLFTPSILLTLYNGPRDKFYGKQWNRHVNLVAYTKITLSLFIPEL